MECSHILLFLGLTAAVCLTGTFTSDLNVPEEILYSGEVMSHADERYRRDVEGAQDSKNLDLFKFFPQKNHTWCFCGKESWLIKFALINAPETKNCFQEAKQKLSENNDPMFVRLLKTVQCGYACLFQKLNLINSDSKFNKDATKELFKKQVFVENRLEEVGAKVIERCLTSGTATKLPEKLLSTATSETNCKPEGHKLISCLLREMVEECPEDLKRNDEPNCKRIYDIYKMARRTSLT